MQKIDFWDRFINKATNIYVIVHIVVVTFIALLYLLPDNFFTW